MTAARLLTLFPTHLYVAENPEHAEIRAGLLEAIEALRDADEREHAEATAGRPYRFNPHSRRYTSYFTGRSQELDQSPAFGRLLTFLRDGIRDFLTRLEFPLDAYHLEISDLWATVHPQRGAHGPHLHQGSLISGTYYVQLPEPRFGGELVLFDPRDAQRMQEAPLLHTAPAADNHVHPPREGELVLFPSYLRHEVRKNANDADRIALSFNTLAIPRGWTAAGRAYPLDEA